MRLPGDRHRPRNREGSTSTTTQGESDSQDTLMTFCTTASSKTASMRRFSDERAAALNGSGVSRQTMIKQIGRQKPQSQWSHDENVNPRTLVRQPGTFTYGRRGPRPTWVGVWRRPPRPPGKNAGRIEPATSALSPTSRRFAPNLVGADLRFSGSEQARFCWTAVKISGRRNRPSATDQNLNGDWSESELLLVDCRR
jgi:hypothetical protein